MQAELEAQFHDFVRARWSHLVRTAYLLTGDAHHAEDLTQTALAKAYRSWRRVSRSDSPEAYVRRMLVSCNSDRFRKRRVRESLTDAPPETAGRDEAVSWADERSALLGALAQLPPKQRAVVVLRYWEDRSIEETAGAMNVSSAAVRTRCVRALARLRALLGEELGEYAAR